MSWLAQNWLAVISILVSLVALKFSIPAYKLNQRALAYDEVLDRFMSDMREGCSHLIDILSNNEERRIDRDHLLCENIEKLVIEWERNTYPHKSSKKTTRNKQQRWIDYLVSLIKFYGDYPSPCGHRSCGGDWVWQLTRSNYDGDTRQKNKELLTELTEAWNDLVALQANNKQ